jgi:hypothetical protein
MRGREQAGSKSLSHNYIDILATTCNFGFIFGLAQYEHAVADHLLLCSTSNN